MSVPLILELLMKENPSVKKTLNDIGASTKAALAAGPITLLPPDQAGKLTIANQLLAQMRAESTSVAKELVVVRDNLNNALKMPGLSQQVAAYGQIQTELKRIGAASEEVRRINPQLEATYRSLAQSAEDGLDRVAQASSTLAGMAQGIATAFGAVGTVFGGLAAGSVAVASNFEQLKARLISVTGSLSEANAEFEKAKSFAATSPFDLAGVVNATVTIKGFQQSSEELLPAVANLASAMGTDLQQAALSVSKAAAGSYEGYENLRNVYAIQTEELRKNGAEVDKQKVLMISTTAQIDKARQALLRIISTRYGDAVARQSATLAGSLSNVGDAGQTLAAGFGQTLIPAATAGAKALSFMLGIVNDIPGPLKAIGAGGAVAIAAVFGVGAAAFGSVAAFLLLQSSLAATVIQLKSLKVEAPAAGAALQFLSTGATRVGGALTATRLASAAFLGAFAAVATVGGVVASSLIDNWQKAEEAMGDSITKAAKDFAGANDTFRTGIAALNAAGKEAGVTVSVVGDAQKQMAEINAGFDKLSKSEVVKAFEQLGVSADQLKDQLKGAEHGAAGVRIQLHTLIKARAEFDRVNGSLIIPFSPTAAQKEALANLKAMGVALEDVDAAINTAKASLARFGEAGAIASRALAAFEGFNAPLKEAATASEQLGTFLDLSRQVGTTHSLTAALGELDTRLKANAAATGTKADNLDSVYDKLKTATLAEKALLLLQIGLMQQRGAIVDTLAKKEEAKVQSALSANETAFRRKKLTQNTELADEIKFLESQLKLVKKGGDDELKILEEIASKKKQLAEKKTAAAKKAAEDEAKAAKKAFEDVLSGAKQGVRDTKAGLDTPSVESGSSPYPLATRANAGVEPSVLASLEAARDRVDAWANANQALIRKYPEIKAQLAKFASDNAMDIQREKSSQLKQTLDTVGLEIQTKLTEAVNSTSKLAVVNDGLATIQRLRGAGLVEEARAQQIINQLTKQKEQLERQITAEQAQRVITIANAELQNLEQELQILEARKEAGEKVDKDITANHQEQLQRRLALIEKERLAAIEAAQGEANAIDAINKKAALDADRVRGDEMLRQLQDYIKLQQLKASATTANSTPAPGGQASSPGGSFTGGDPDDNSPFGASPLNNNPSGIRFDKFTLGAPFSLSESLRPAYEKMLEPGRKAPEFQRIRDAVNPSKRDPSLSNAINDAARAKKAGDVTKGGGGSSITQSIYVNGAKLEITKPALKAAVTEVLKEVAGDAKFRGA